MEGWRHAATLAKAVAVLVVGRIAHLVVVLIAVWVETPTASSSLRTVTSSPLVIPREGMTGFASEMGAVLRSQSVRVGRRGALSHVALQMVLRSALKFFHVQRQGETGKQKCEVICGIS